METRPVYGKVFASMFDGSMRGAGSHVFAVWTWVLSHSDLEGFCEVNVNRLADEIGESTERVKKAIEYLCKPDPESRSETLSGARLEKIGKFGYSIVNYKKYRELRAEEERRIQNREAQQRARDKKGNASANVSESQQKSELSQQPSADVSIGHQKSAASAHVEGEGEEEEKNNPVTPSFCQQSATQFNKPKSLTDLIEYCQSLAWYISPEDAQYLSDSYSPPGGDGVWRYKSGEAVTDWRKCVVTWKRNQKAKPKGTALTAEQILANEQQWEREHGLRD